MEYKDDSAKALRVLEMYTALINGKTIYKQEETEKNDKSEKTFHRDLKLIRNFMELKGVEDGELNTIIYDRKEKGYKLQTEKIDKMTKNEILAICKIILDSRAFVKEEMTNIINKLLKNFTTDEDCKIIKDLILNEHHHYVELQHKTSFMDKMWDIGIAIKENRKIEIKYNKLGSKKEIVRILKPAAIMFSEFYFYMAAFIDKEHEDVEFENKDDKFPTIYRIDRIKEIKITNEKFKVLYNSRFEEGDFRKRIQFMYAGKLQKIKLQCKKISLEAVLDRLPTAKVQYENDDECIVSAQVFGKGIDMWIRSQGDMIKLLED